jgi:hypothetical protein
MLIVGTADGTYRVTGVADGGDISVQKPLDTPRAERVRQFNAVDGVFAATEAGLYYTTDGTDWTDLGVPRDSVWAVTVSPTGDHLYAGTVPAHVYATPLPADDITSDGLDWRELDGFQDLPSREEWGVPRHDNKARVRDLCIHPNSPSRLIAGVEPGGVHVSTDAGDSWTERNETVHDDIHSLHVVADGEVLAATGRGLYRTVDAGQTWTRLDEGFEQRYFRTVYEHEGTIYASAACVPPSDRWETSAADPALFASTNGTSLERLDTPCPEEVVVGWTTTDDSLLGVTHRGTILGLQDNAWGVVGGLPSEETIPGCYYNLTWDNNGTD